MASEDPLAADRRVENHPDPDDVATLENHIREAASEAMGLGDEVDLAIFIRDDGVVVAGIAGWTWGDCRELQSLWVAPSYRGKGLGRRLIAEAEAEAAARGCTQTIHFAFSFQPRKLYEAVGYEVIAHVEDFPSGWNALWFRKNLTTPTSTVGPRTQDGDTVRGPAHTRMPP